MGGQVFEREPCRVSGIADQLQRTSKMEYVIEPTKTNAGTRVIPMTKEVTEMFRAIIQDRPEYKVEKVVGGYTYKVQIPNITPTYAVIHIAPTWRNPA